MYEIVLFETTEEQTAKAKATQWNARNPRPDIAVYRAGLSRLTGKYTVWKVMRDRPDKPGGRYLTWPHGLG